MKKLLLFILFVSQFAFGVTANKVWRIPSGGTLPTWGPVNLADPTNAVTGLLPGSNIASSPNFSGTVQENGKNVAVSNTNATNSLSIIRGVINTNATINSGEGFTVAAGITGQYTITFSTAFSDKPAVIAQVINSSTSIPVSEIFSSVSSTAFSINWQNSGTVTAVNTDFMFIAIGQRN